MTKSMMHSATLGPYFVLAFALAPAWRTARLAAQANFEGIVTQNVTAFPGREVTTWVKGPRFRAQIPGPDGNMMTMISNERGGIVMLIAEQKTYYTLSAGGRGAGGSPPTVTPTGRTETIAGSQCTYYHLHRASGEPANEDLCVTSAFGYIKPARAPGMDEQFIRRTWPDGFLVLKSIDANGKVQSQVTRIQKTAVSDALFSPPSDYTELRMPGNPGLGALRKP